MGLNVKQTLLTTALTLVSLNSFASNWFEIELVLFERHNEISREQWRQDAPDIDHDNALDFISRSFILPDCPNVTPAEIAPVIADLTMIACAKIETPTRVQLTEQDETIESVASDYQALMPGNHDNLMTESIELPALFSVNGTNYQVKPQPNKLPITMASTTLATKLIKPHLLDQASLKLTTLVKKLRWQKNLTPKLHLGWRQDVLARHLAKPVRLVAGKRFDSNYKNTEQGSWEFDGLFKVYLNHYLFIETNINHKLVTMVEVEQFDEDIVVEQAPTSVSLLQADIEQVMTEPQPIQPVSVPWLINHNLKQHRRVKSKELHYFDHPDFGLVVQIRRFSL